MFDITIIIFFLFLSLAASTINGALGYGYSSISAPLAILVFINRIINPAYVLLEAIINTVMLGFSGRKHIKATVRRVAPVIAAVVPGVIIGSYFLSIIAPLWVRLIVYAAILPMILLQTAGWRRPIKNEAAASVPLGAGVGLLYSITTISGPPIALFWNNQGLAKSEFKAAVAQIRIAESYVTCVSYYFLGLFSLTSLQLFGVIAPPVLIGIPLGMFLANKLAMETFRRICMSFDAGIVSYGLSQTLVSLFKLSLAEAYSFWFAIISVDGFLVYRFFRTRSSSMILPTGESLAPKGGTADGRSMGNVEAKSLNSAFGNNQGEKLVITKNENTGKYSSDGSSSAQLPEKYRTNLPADNE